MKIFKHAVADLLVEDTFKKLEIGETIITKVDDNDKVQFEVHQCNRAGIYPYQGGFNSLKMAVKFAESIERPDLIINYYQIIDLSGGQRILLYYALHEKDVMDYIEAMEYDFTVEIPIADSGMKVIFLTPKETVVQEKISGIQREEFVLFGKYMMSQERRKRFEKTDPNNVEQRLGTVHDADFDWFESYKQDFYSKQYDKVTEEANEKALPELLALKTVESMFKESLSPETYELYQDNILPELIHNRSDLN